MTAEGSDPLFLKRNPQVFKQMSYDLAKKISARVMNQGLSPADKLLCEEIFSPGLEKILKEYTDRIWLEFNIEEKAAGLVALADATTSEKPAWRPKTGVVDIDVQANALRYQNALLEKLLKKNEAYIEDLEAAITSKRNDEDEQIARIVKVTNEMY